MCYKHKHRETWTLEKNLNKNTTLHEVLPHYLWNNAIASEMYVVVFVLQQQKHVFPLLPI